MVPLRMMGAHGVSRNCIDMQNLVCTLRLECNLGSPIASPWDSYVMQFHFPYDALQRISSHITPSNLPSSHHLTCITSLALPPSHHLPPPSFPFHHALSSSLPVAHPGCVGPTFLERGRSLHSQPPSHEAVQLKTSHHSTSNFRRRLVQRSNGMSSVCVRDAWVCFLLSSPGPHRYTLLFLTLHMPFPLVFIPLEYHCHEPCPVSLTDTHP
jgi:hypothetical protein